MSIEFPNEFIQSFWFLQKLKQKQNIKINLKSIFGEKNNFVLPSLLLLHCVHSFSFDVWPVFLIFHQHQFLHHHCFALLLLLLRLLSAQTQWKFVACAFFVVDCSCVDDLGSVLSFLEKIK